MKFKMCSCKWNGGLTRPEGPVKIESTRLLHSNPGKDADILVARLSGAVNAEVRVVKTNGKYFFDAPKSLGGRQAVPADSLTDAVNYKAWELGDQISRKKGLKTGEKRSRGGH